MDGQAGERAEFGCEGLRLSGLGAGLAREVNGVADDDGYDAKTFGKPCKGPQVFSGDAGRWATPLQGQDRLSCKPQLVGHGNPDAAIADVETEIAKDSFQLLAPGF